MNMASAFCGVFELQNVSGNITEIHRTAFANILSKVTFHTGISESSLLATFSKATCTLSILPAPGGQQQQQQSPGFNWALCFGGDVMAVRQSVHLDDEFDYQMPITGEFVKINVTFSKSERTLVQTATFQNQSRIEYKYSLFPGGLNVHVNHLPSELAGEMKFYKRESRGLTA